jgi:branched-chain amino acid transport system permease protein
VTLAMLVIGGVRSLWGAVVGALLVSGINSLLLTAENGLDLWVTDLTVPTGTRLVTLGVVMALILIFRPRGLTGGREVTLGRS